jgi:DNA-directed RNA polymerase subunit alpha
MLEGALVERAMIDLPIRPTIQLLAADERYGRFAIAPLEYGYATTLGNALRRVLLSSIPGSAVTRIKIDGIFHEFASIPNVREDVTELVLNIKGIRLRSYVERGVKLLLTHTQAGPVRAQSIDAPSSIELVNPDQYLCTMDSDGLLVIELTVERGRGALLADQQARGSIGDILVDAIFSPVPKVNVVVEPVHSAVAAEQERLILEIWTDGTLKAGDALRHAAALLAQYHQAIVDGLEPGDRGTEATSQSLAVPAGTYETPLETLELSTRTYNTLKRSGITTVGHVLEIAPTDLNGIRNMGSKSVEELLAQLQAHGFRNNDDVVGPS